MSAITIRQMAERVDELLGLRLGARGEGLYEKLRHRGAKLPAKVRRAAEGLAEAAEVCRDQRLIRLLNEAEIARDYDTCLRYLGEKRVVMRHAVWRDARRRVVLGALAAVVICGLFAVWRG